jgi:hypothetical protein
MKRASPYLLILLLIGAEVDDALAIVPSPSTGALAADNDEYLPAERQSEAKRSGWDQRPVLSGLISFDGLGCLSFSAWPMTRDWVAVAPFCPPSLFVFMSLQI